MVRREAVLSLLKSPDNARAGLLHERARPKVVNMLLHNLSHPSHAVKLTAMYGLELLGDPCAIGHLLPLAQEIDCPVRHDAQRLIERLTSGQPDPLTLLRAAAPDSDAPESLLRPARTPADKRPETLLRPPNSA
jgi:HEAT repeat protein